MKLSAVCKINVFLIFLSLLFFLNIFPVPQNNPYDSFPLYTVIGSNKFFVKKDKFAPSLQITPYYQSSSGARNESGTKVPEGDRIGRWNMLALFFGASAAPIAKPYTFYPSTDTTNKYNPTTSTSKSDGGYPYFALAHSVLNGQYNDSSSAEEDVTRYPDNTGTNNITYWQAKFATVAADLKKQVGETAATQLSRIFTDENYYDDTDVDKGHFSVPISYEKMGLRGQFNLDFGFGLGVNIKSGVTDYKQKPTFNDKTGAASGSADNTLIRRYLTNTYGYIFDELGLDVEEFHDTSMEDTHIQVYYNIPFDLFDNDDELIATFIPNFSVGLWCPTGPAQKNNKAFSLPTGNDGFWGITVEGALNIDFPGTVQLSFGGGLVGYLSKTLKNYRVASSENQTGVYPWMAPSVKKRPGVVWYVNAAFMALNFLDNLSAYFEYIYMRHDRDSITVKGDTTTQTAAFKPNKTEEDSVWQNSFIQGGLNYAITTGLEMGLGFQAHLGGKSVYKTTTILGTITLNF